MMIILSLKIQQRNLKKQFTCSEQGTEKGITFTVTLKNKLQELIKTEKKLQKNISYILQLIDNARFMATYYQILLVILLKEFIELNVNLSMMTKIETYAHPACDVIATSHLGLIQVGTLLTMLRLHRYITICTAMRRTYLRRLCDV